MRFARLLILLVSFKKPIVASAQLIPRQEQGFWPDFGFWDGAAFLRGVGNLFVNPQDTDTSTTKPPPDTDTTSDRQTSPDSPEVSPASPPSSDTSSPAEPVYQLNINNDPSPLPDHTPDIPAVLPSLNEECDPIDKIEADCGKTTDQLIFTSSCIGIDPSQVVSAETRAQNQAIREALDVINGQNLLAGRGGRGLRISTSHICDVFFFAVPLTKNQIQDIEKKPGVDSVRPNQDIPPMEEIPQSSDLEDSDPVKMPVFNLPGSRLKDRGTIISDRLAWEDLRFISTPRDSDLSTAYLYDSNAGQYVTVIAIDSGANALHDEFVSVAGESPLLEDRIYAMDTFDLPDEYDTTATCRTSKIVGRTCGVARKAKVLVTMVYPSVSSVVDAFVQISNYLISKNVRAEKVAGYHVMSIMVQWDNTDEEINRRFDVLLDLLIKYFQVIVVVPSGTDTSYRNSDINRWPATTERRHDIIVVGGVEVHSGRTYTFTRGGPFLSVNAPGYTKCASGRGPGSYMRRRGTDVAAAQVAGLIAYFLSLDNIGPAVRRNEINIPRWMKHFITTTASYKRLDDDFPAIWNLLGSRY